MRVQLCAPASLGLEMACALRPCSLPLFRLRLPAGLVLRGCSVYLVAGRCALTVLEHVRISLCKLQPSQKISRVHGWILLSGTEEGAS